VRGLDTLERREALSLLWSESGSALGHDRLGSTEIAGSADIAVLM
jgi:hypothetical protein